MRNFAHFNQIWESHANFDLWFVIRLVYILNLTLNIWTLFVCYENDKITIKNFFEKFKVKIKIKPVRVTSHKLELAYTIPYYKAHKENYNVFKQYLSVIIYLLFFLLLLELFVFPNQYKKLPNFFYNNFKSLNSDIEK